MEKSHPKTALLTTSSVTDVVYSGAQKPVVNITGLNPMRLEDIASITIKKSKSEVAQVVTIGGSTPTPTVGVAYRVAIKRPGSSSNSTENDFNKVFSATLPADQGSAALNRQWLYDKLTADINKDVVSNIVTAAAGSGGAGMTITDVGGYFSDVHNAHASGRGATTVKLLTDPSTGTGFDVDADIAITTEAQYGVGVGATLQKWGAGDSNYGNAVQESRENKDALADAVSGQFYNYYSFESVVPSNFQVGSGVGGFKVIHQELYVDNGTGASTTNLTGYFAFEKKIEEILYGYIYKKAPNTIAAFFNVAPVRMAAAGGLPTGTAGDENIYQWADEGTSLMQSILGTQTILYSQVVATGLRLTQDAADNDGMEFHTQYGANSPYLITVGAGTYSIRARIQIGDVSDTDEVQLGFREAVAVEAAYTNYEDYAILAIDTATGDVKMKARDNAGTAKSTDTAINWADGEAHDLEVRLKEDGTTEFLIDDVDYSNLIATADIITHTAGQTLIPYVRVLNAAAGDPEVDVEKLFFINDIAARD